MFSDFRSEQPGSEPTVPVSTEFAYVVAGSGASHLKHGRIDYAIRQQHPTTADEEGVFRWAGVLGIPIQQPEKSTGTALAFGSNGSTITIGETLVFQDDDQTYVVTANATIPAIEQVEIFIEAVTAGAAGRLASKSILNFESPPAGVQSTVTVLEMTGGQDLETADHMLSRILVRLGGGKDIGKPSDWEEWAFQSGASRAWEVKGLGGPGSVGIFFVLDNDPVSIFPDAATVATFQSEIEAKAPTPATTIATAPVDDPLDIQVVITPDTPDIRSAVELELEDMLLREVTAKGFTLTLSKISEAISRAPGEDSNVLVSPVVDQTYAVGTIPTLGIITFI